MDGLIRCSLTPAWWNWRPAGHIRPETIYNQVHQIICQFVTSYYKLIYFFNPKDLKRKILILLSSAALRMSATHDFKILP
jgi:hypothetical protein